MNNLINKSLQVLILCGGKGERLRPLTDTIPKPLIEIKNKPILSYVIKHLESYDLNNIILATGYKSDNIHKFLKKNDYGLSMKIIDSGDVDIIKRIQDATRYIKNDLLVLYGDTISDININNLVEYHQSHIEPMTMTVWPLRSQFGLVDIDKNGKVIQFQEKPILEKWINIGYFYLDNKILDMINQYKRYADFLQDIAREGMLNAYQHTGLHITVNTVEELNEAENSIIEIIKKGDYEN
jgi:glucose-1-phosphate cytidylyltransferase